MFDTILDNLSNVQNETVAMSKQQYEWGWFDDKAITNATLKDYIRSNVLTATSYKEITDEDYTEEVNS